MALTIRLSLVGKRSQPIYRIVVGEKRSKRDGKNTEVIGYYNPNINPPDIKFKQDRLNYWQSKGALISTGLKRILDKDK